MATYEFTRWSGSKEIVQADQVEFGPGGELRFTNLQSPPRIVDLECGIWTERTGGLVLAVKSGDWNDVRQIISEAEAWVPPLVHVERAAPRRHWWQRSDDLTERRRGLDSMPGVPPPVGMKSGAAALPDYDG